MNRAQIMTTWLYTFQKLLILRVTDLSIRFKRKTDKSLCLTAFLFSIFF